MPPPALRKARMSGEFVLVVEYVQKRLSTRLRQWGKQRI
jgi:hypothetical protein